MHGERESTASINTRTDAVRLSSGHGVEGNLSGEFWSLKLRLVKPHLMGLLVFGLNKDIIKTYLKSPERFLVTERGTFEGIKASEGILLFRQTHLDRKTTTNG